MCFSPTVSFVSSAVLIPIGLASSIFAAKRHKKAFLLSLTPILFGIQQASEGMVWLGLQNNNPWMANTFALCFLFFALFLWPFWTPLSINALEERGGARKKIMQGFVALGFFLGLYLYLPLFFQPHFFRPEVFRSCIKYNEMFLYVTTIPLQRFVGLLYITIVVVPCLMSYKLVKIFGALVFFAALFTYLSYMYAFTSVWCFFSAILSIYILLGIIKTAD